MEEHVVYQSPPVKRIRREQRPFPKRKAPRTILLPGFRLTNRDREIVRAVYEYRVLSSDQIERLLFLPPQSQPRLIRPTRCQSRLKLLFQAGYLVREEQPQKPSEGRKPFLYLLTQKGAKRLADHLSIRREQLDWRPKDNRVLPLFLQHLLVTNDIRIAFILAAKRHGYVLEIWLDERTLKHPENRDYVILPGSMRDGFSKRRVPVLPDGYFVMRAGNKRGHFFLEVDRGTEQGSRFAEKVLAYESYVQSGQYQKRFKTNSLRVLTVTTSRKRLENLRSVTQRVGSSGMFLFSTFDKVVPADVLTGRIWITPAGSARSLIETATSAICPLPLTQP